MGWFDGNDPQKAYALLGMLQGLNQVSGPSRMPIGFGSVMGNAGAGALEGMLKGRTLADQQAFLGSLGQQSPAPMSPPPSHQFQGFGADMMKKPPQRETQYPLGFTGAQWAAGSRSDPEGLIKAVLAQRQKAAEEAATGRVVGPGGVLVTGGQQTFSNPRAREDKLLTPAELEQQKQLRQTQPDKLLSPEELAQQLQLRQAGRSNVNVTNDMKGEGAFVTQRGKDQAERLKGLVAAADVARTKSSMLDALEQSLAASPYRGPMADLLTDANRFTTQIGLTDDNTSDAQAARAVSNQFALLLRNPAGGMGMPGALSDNDLRFLRQSVPSLKNSPQGGQALIGIMRKMSQREAQVAQFAQQYSQAHNELGAGFDQELKAWANSNPLFDAPVTPMAPQAPQAPSMAPQAPTAGVSDGDALLKKYGIQ